MFYLIRHGETDWNVAGLQTSFTDLPLNQTGRRQALALKFYLKKKDFAQVWCSPLLRACETCELAGFGEQAHVRPDLTEWHAGEYEGLKTEEIQQKYPGWSMMTHGAPGGESLEQIEQRARQVIEAMCSAKGDILIFSSSHFLRALAACFVGLSPAFGKNLFLGSATVSILDEIRQGPVIRLWNYQVS